MLLNDMHVRQVRADKEREIAERMRDRAYRPEPRSESRSVRRAVGRSMISIGVRLAAEPQTSRTQTESALRLARSR
jgi:hypothetical protein